MKRILLICFLLLPAALFAQEGYEIKVTLKPFQNQMIYLGHYFGKSYPIIDSAMLNEQSVAVFKSSQKLTGGIYLVGYPGKKGFFEILIDKNQKFSIIADTATLSQGIQFENSPGNILFNGYQKTMNEKGRQIEELKKQIKIAANPADSATLAARLAQADVQIKQFREDLIQHNPESLLATLLTAMREPEMTGRLKDPKTKQDSLDAYQYYKGQYWQGVHFWDGRFAFTPFFEDKLDKYFNQVVTPHPDSVIKELDYMLGFAAASEEMSRFLLIKFVNRYLNQKYMWEDAVFVHLFEKYFSNKNYTWLTDKGKKLITDRAYSLMANITGNPASEIILPDSSGMPVSLYDLVAPFTIVVFWDPVCGHCKEVLPRLDSFYRNRWKAAGMKMVAVAKETDGSRKDWLQVAEQLKLQEWTHVYYAKSEEKSRIDAGIPGYSQLYDVQSFPTLYLLDHEKRIIAKKLTVDQLDEILSLKLKNR